MSANKSVAQRLGRVLETVTRQSGRLPDTPEYGSWLLGKASESQRRRRVRIQIILTVLLLSANVLGIAVAMLLVIVVFPVPSVFNDAPKWITFAVTPAYLALALVVGIFSITRRTVNALRWSIEQRKPTREDQLNTFRAPWQVSRTNLTLWGVGAALLTTLYVTAGSRVHSSVCILRRFQRRRVGHPVLPAHRIRVAAGCGASSGGRAAAAPAHRGDHGPDHDRVAALAVFGAPNHLDHPEDEALAAGRAIARRIGDEAPECEAGIGVASGQAVAGNVGAKERFEYTVIGEPVNEAARLCKLAKSTPAHLLASSQTVQNASENERGHWTFGDTVTLGGHDEPTRLALPV